MNAQRYSFSVAWSDEDEAYVATCPEFEGVSGFGSTPGAAIKEATVALKLTVETFTEKGWPLPEVKKVSQFSGQFRLRLPKSTHARLAKEAEEEGVSLNAYVNALIERNSGAIETVQKIQKQMQEMISTATSPKPLHSTGTAFAASPSAMPKGMGGGRWLN